MRLQGIALAGALAVAVAACGSGLQVTSDWDPSVDFSGFQTFAVLDEASGGQHVDQFTTSRIKSAIAATLTEKGMRQVDSIDELSSAFQQASSEAQASFSNASVFLEKFIDRRARGLTRVRVGFQDQVVTYIVEERERERGAAWALGTSILFEIVLVGVCCLIFSRRDY